MKNTFGNVKHFARDLVILVLGIMLSLMLNEWRENRSARADEMRVVNQMVEDLMSDTTMLSESLATVEALSELTVFTSSEDALMTDSLQKAGISSWSLAAYAPMVPQKTAFHELTYQDQHRNIRFPKLASRFINLHEGIYSLLDRVTNQHADYLLSDLAPYMNVSMPPIKQILNKQPSALESVRRQLQNTEMQNRIEWVNILLINVDSVMNAAKAESEELLTEIKEKYNL
ncbi:MAG: hypothetical protein AAFO91_03185, partial [Bacteroidota bacterium]